MPDKIDDRRTEIEDTLRILPEPDADEEADSADPVDPVDLASKADPVDPETSEDPDDSLTSSEADLDDGLAAPNDDDRDDLDDRTDEDFDNIARNVVRDELHPLERQLARLEALLTERQNPGAGELQEQVLEEPAPFVEFTQEELDNLLLDPSGLGEALNRVGEAAYRRAVEDARQSMRSELPQLLDTHTSQREALQAASTRFWKENAALIEGQTPEVVDTRRRMVASIAGPLASAHPDWSLERLYAETGRRARAAILGEKSQGDSSSKRSRRSRRRQKFAKGSQTRGSKTAQTPADARAREIEQTLTLNRGYAR